MRARRLVTDDEAFLSHDLEQLQDGRVAGLASEDLRDLEELGVVKHNGHYTLPRTDEGAASRGLLGLDPVGECLVVAKCEPGLASSVAVEIDRAAIPEIVGTLAGEDTVFIAVPERKAQRAVMKKVLELFG